MKIAQDFIPEGQGVRTGYKLTACRGLVIHWIGVPQGKASVIRGNFERGELGTQYIIDWYTGGIIQTMPENEVTYHVGATSYTALKEKLVGGDNPNWYFVGIECCIGDKSIPADWATLGKHMELGRPSDKQYAALVEFAADFLIRHGLGTENLYRHYDITGKLCHVWFVKDEKRWEQFKADVGAGMDRERPAEGGGYHEKEDEDMTEKEIQTMVNAAVEKALAERDAIQAEAAQRVSPWAKEKWDKVTASGVLDGTRPGGVVTREQLATVLDRLGLAE